MELGTECSTEINKPDTILKSIFDKLDFLVCVLEPDGALVYANKVSKTFFAGELEQVTIDRILEAWKESSFSEGGFELEIGDKSYKITVSEAQWFDGKDCKLIVATDITEIVYSKRCILHAHLDSMTKIYNRESGMNYLDLYIANFRKDEQVFSACYLDINDLKYVNDNFGHSEGDIYIMTVVSVIKSSIRNTDIFVRMGGDEFLILFPKCHYEIVAHIMQAVTDKLEEINKSGKNVYPYSISYGMLEVSDMATAERNNILNTIDSKMYIMKNFYKKNKSGAFDGKEERI